MRNKILVGIDRSIGVLLLFTTLLFAENKEVSIPDTQGSQNSYVVIPVNVNNAEGIVGFQFKITYDENILNAIGVEKGSLTSDWVISSNVENKGEITIAGFSFLLQDLPSISGSLVMIKFKVVGSSGNTNLKFEFSKMVNNLGNPIEFTTKDGNFIVSGTPQQPATISGTISYDGTKTGIIYVYLAKDKDFKDIVESTTIENLGSYTIPVISEGTYYICAFMNVKGDIDPVGKYPTSIILSQGERKTGIDITLEDPKIKNVSIPADLSGTPGSEISIPINIDNASGTASFGFKINYLEDILEFISCKKGSLISDDFGVGYQKIETGGVKIIGSATKSPIMGEKGSLVILKMKVKDNAQIGSTTYLKFDTNNCWIKDLPIGDLSEMFSVDYTDGKFEVIKISIKKGDVNGDGKVGLADAIISLKIVAGIDPGVPVYKEADVNSDGRIGLAEAIYALKVLAGIIQE